MLENLWNLEIVCDSMNNLISAFCVCKISVWISIEQPHPSDRSDHFISTRRIFMEH